MATEEPDRVWAINELADLYFGTQADSNHRAALSRRIDRGQYFSGALNQYRPRPRIAVEQKEVGQILRERVDLETQTVAIWLRQVADAPGKAPVDPPPGLPAQAVAEAIELLEETALYGGEGQGARQMARKFDYPGTRSEPDRARARKAAELMRKAHLHGPPAPGEHPHPDWGAPSPSPKGARQFSLS